MYAFGDGEAYQLGNGEVGDSPNTPIELTIGESVVAIGESRNAGYAVGTSGQGYAWGSSTDSALGLGPDTVAQIPTAVPGITEATAVAGGQGHVLWLMSDGTVQACGNNDFGQLGDGSTTNRKRPVQASITDVVAICAGNQFSGAITSSGAAFMWGRNTYGQCGVSSKAHAIIAPTLVNLPTECSTLSAGGDRDFNGHTLAVLSDSSCWAWGCDADYQLGDDMRTSQWTPVKITPLAGYTYASMAAGGQHSFALTTTNALLAWGYGTDGQLGTGGTGTQRSPVVVATGVVLVSTTADCSMLVT